MNGKAAKKLRREARRQFGSGGDVRLCVTSKAHGFVVVDFGRPIMNLNLPAAEARRLGEALLAHADRARPVEDVSPRPRTPPVELGGVAGAG